MRKITLFILSAAFIIAAATEAKAQAISYDYFIITAYCPCKKCCGQWSHEVTGKPNKTSTGTEPKTQHTIAVDPEYIPYGSKVIIGGIEYVAEDAGVKGRHIDIYFEDHKEAVEFGKQKLEVFINE